MVFHVLNLGVCRNVLFTKDEDFLAFERVVEETLRTRRMRLCADCLMPNHWHLVVWPERDGDLPAFMQQVTNTHVKRWKGASSRDRVRPSLSRALQVFPGGNRRLLLPGRSLRGAERPACKPRGASGIVALVEFCAVSSAKARRFPSSRRGLCHAPPIGCKLSTNRKQKPKWRRCVAASIAVGPSAILTGSRTRPSDLGWN
ncbi:MAG: transposase [Isosphaerales bacterium]